MWNCGLCFSSFTPTSIWEHVTSLHTGRLDPITWHCGHCHYQAPTFDSLAAHALRLGHPAQDARVEIGDKAVGIALHALAEIQESLGSEGQKVHKAPFDASKAVASHVLHSTPVQEEPLRHHLQDEPLRHHPSAYEAPRQKVPEHIQGWKLDITGDLDMTLGPEAREEYSATEEEKLPADLLQSPNKSNEMLESETSLLESSHPPTTEVMESEEEDNDESAKFQVTPLATQLRQPLYRQQRRRLNRMGLKAPKTYIRHPLEGAKRSSILDENESVLTIPQLLNLQLELSTLQSEFESEEGGMRWMARVGLIANRMPCQRKGDDGLVCGANMAMIAHNGAKRVEMKSKLIKAGVIPLVKKERARDDSHGRCVDGHNWRCNACRVLHGRYSTRYLRAGTIFHNAHFAFREIMAEMYAWCHGLEADTTSRTRVGAPIKKRYRYAAVERRWVRQIRDLCFEWCLEHASERVREELENSSASGRRTEEEVDYFKIFVQAHPQSTFQHLLALIRKSQESRHPEIFLPVRASE